MKEKCWLIGEGSRRWLPSFEAASRGLPLRGWRYGPLADIPAKPGAIIAVDFDNFQGLATSARVSLREKIIAGATCYIGGGSVGRQYSLTPLAPVMFEVERQARSPRHTFTAHPLLPAVLRGESIEHCYTILAARGLPELAQPLTLARTGDGLMATTLFAIKLGAGVIICDLIVRSQVGGTVKSTPSLLLRLLENPASRLGIIGPLVAIDRALGRDADRPVGCDIVLDDRPVNLDYFNIRKLRNFVGYLTDRCPGIHIDFGWTPDQSRPSRRYVEAIKEFNAGFFWHGLLHHIDHRSIGRPELHFMRGQHLVEEISERYQVRFQPVMVFPYEKDTADCVDLLKRKGFIAKAETTDHVTAGTSSFEESDVTITPEAVSNDASSGFAILGRDSIETVTRDRMLARAVLGMPIIAAAHPRNAGLRRWSKIRPDRQAGEEFNEVLDFIAAKKLRPRSLEELAHDQIATRKSLGLASYQEFATEQASGRSLVI
jgi:hypothetical protein